MGIQKIVNIIAVYFVVTILTECDEGHSNDLFTIKKSLVIILNYEKLIINLYPRLI